MKDKKIKLDKPQKPQLNIPAVICSVCGCEKEKDKDCDYCIRQYALSWGL
jgi:hypothetical protein